MLTIPAVLGAPLYFEAMRARSIAVAAARTTSAVVVNPQTNFAQRAGTFDHVSEGGLR